MQPLTKAILATGLLSFGCSALHGVDDDEICIELEVGYSGAAGGELYIYGTKLDFNGDQAGESFRYYEVAEVGFQHLEPSSTKGSVRCSSGPIGFARWSHAAWIDGDGSDAEACATPAPFEFRGPDCGPGLDDPQVTVYEELDAGEYHIIRLELVDP